MKSLATLQEEWAEKQAAAGDGSTTGADSFELVKGDNGISTYTTTV